MNKRPHMCPVEVGHVGTPTSKLVRRCPALEPSGFAIEKQPPFLHTLGFPLRRGPCFAPGGLYFCSNPCCSWCGNPRIVMHDGACAYMRMDVCVCVCVCACVCEERARTWKAKCVF